MAINLAKNYTPLLDELYKEASVTSILTSDASLVKEGQNAHEIMIPKMAVSGLGDYSRNSGYVNGSVSVDWETHTLDYDRGVKLAIDAMDNEETFDIAFGQASQVLMKTQVAPEGDAYTFATLAGADGVGEAEETLANGEQAIASLTKATTEMDDNEVPQEGRILFATPTVINSIKSLDTTKSREILDGFAAVVKVPQTRFYTAIDLKDGKEDGYGYAKADEGKKINYMIVEPTSLIKFNKHVASNVISPDANPDSDAYIVKYREYGIVSVYENKTAGIYVSHVGA